MRLKAVIAPRLGHSGRPGDGAYVLGVVAAGGLEVGLGSADDIEFACLR